MALDSAVSRPTDVAPMAARIVRMRDGLPLSVLLKASKANVLRLARFVGVPAKLGNRLIEDMPRRELAANILFAIANSKPTLDTEKKSFPHGESCRHSGVSRSSS